jgi:hypothetical protein
VSAAIALTSGCGGADCSSVARFALVVHVEDATGTPVCDASVTVTDGDFSATLTAEGTASNCTYSGPAEREGTYTVEASRGGATGQTDGVSVKRSGDCDVLNTEQVTVKLNA